MAQYIDLSTRRGAARKPAAGVVAAGVVTALLVGAAGAIHLYLYFDYFHRVHVVGVLFLVNAAVGLLTGAVLLFRREGFVLLAAAGYAVGTLAAFVVSTRWGLFGYRETFWGSWQEAAGGVELAAALIAVLLLAARLDR
jgi:hypothetical protein